MSTYKSRDELYMYWFLGKGMDNEHKQMCKVLLCTISHLNKDSFLPCGYGSGVVSNNVLLVISLIILKGVAN